MGIPRTLGLNGAPNARDLGGLPVADGRTVRPGLVFRAQALGRLFALTEAYPTLKATGNVAQLQEELTSTENKIGFARQLYNDVATQYNTKQATFPTLLIAGLAKASPAELWEIEDAAERAVPTVDLSMNKPAP